MGENQIELNSDSPKYAQVREIIRTRIEDGEYLPGMAIPSESDLVEEFGIHRLTVRNAIDSLVREGLLKPIQGKGVYVLGKKIKHNLESLAGFRQKIREQGLKPTVKILVKTIRTAGLKFAKLLEIEPEEEIFYIRRLYLVDDEPYSIEDVYIPKEILPAIEFTDLDVFSLYDIMEFNGIIYQHAQQTVETTRLDSKDARWLKIDSETPVLVFNCISRDQDGRVFEFNQSYTRSDKASYQVSFSKTFQNTFISKQLAKEDHPKAKKEAVVVGVDLGASYIKVGLMTVKGEPIDFRTARLEKPKTDKTGVNATIDLVEKILKDNGSPAILGIGVGASGPVDPVRGTILSPYSVPSWSHIPYSQPVSEHFQVPVVLENDADTAALAEYWQGVGKDVSRLLAVTVGTGIGTALIIDGKIYRGLNGAHPEAGHHIIDPSGPECYCGAKGCWESLASGEALTDYARAVAKENPSWLEELNLKEPASVNGAITAQAARQGNAIARQIMDREAYYFSLGLLNLITAYVPERVVLSGGVIESYDLIEPKVIETMQKHHLMVPAPEVQILRAKLGYHAGIIGAAYALLQKLELLH